MARPRGDLRDFGVDTSRITQRSLLRESNSLAVAETDGRAYLDQAFVALLDRLGIYLNAHRGLLEHREAYFASSRARLERLQNSVASYITDLSFFKRVFRERTGITVSTIHGVKGAEFDVVIAFGLLQGIVPHFSDSDADVAGSKLVYILASRARKHLHLISEIRAETLTQTQRFVFRKYVLDKPNLIAEYSFHTGAKHGLDPQSATLPRCRRSPRLSGVAALGERRDLPALRRYWRSLQA